MKRLVFVLAFVLPSCAYGSMIDDAIEEIEGTLSDLHTAECIRECTDVAELCLDEANGTCVDTCEIEEDQCATAEEACTDAGAVSCVYLSGFAYTNCMDQVRDNCDADCGGQASDCNQVCADQAQECLTTDADCVADCVQQLEDSLKGIDIG